MVTCHNNGDVYPNQIVIGNGLDRIEDKTLILSPELTRFLISFFWYLYEPLLTTQPHQ